MALKPSMTVLVGLCLTASAALFFFGTGLIPVWILLWLAPIPVLWLAPRVSYGRALFFAAAAYVLGTFDIWFYLTIVTPVWVTLLFVFAPACLFATAVVLFRNRMLRGRLWQAALIGSRRFWVSYEYVTSLVSIHGTIGNISYSQMNFLPILQLGGGDRDLGHQLLHLVLRGYGCGASGSGSRQGEADPRGDGGGCSSSASSVMDSARLARSPKNAPMVKVGLVASDDSRDDARAHAGAGAGDV